MKADAQKDEVELKPDLLPCPFCGSAVRLMWALPDIAGVQEEAFGQGDGPEDADYSIACSGCPMETDSFATAQIITNLWNTRDESELKQLRERLNRALEDNIKPRSAADWIEDYEDEDNGCYEHLCATCNATFYGHKRRVSDCKVCVLKQAREREAKLRAALERYADRENWVGVNLNGLEATNKDLFVPSDNGYDIARQALDRKEE